MNGCSGRRKTWRGMLQKKRKRGLGNKRRERSKGKAIPYIEDSEDVVTPINSAGRVGFKVKANTRKESKGNIQVVRPVHLPEDVKYG